jgi:hypothetical protein
MLAVQIPSDYFDFNRDYMGPYNEVFNDPQPEANFLIDYYDCYINEFNS